MKKENEVYWEKMGKDYSQVWKSAPKQLMSKKESYFVEKYINFVNPQCSLDIGVGNGRILEVHVNAKIKKIYGIDISKKMVEICLERFRSRLNIKSIKVSDISIDRIPFDNKFDFVSAIRVLKYNKNWKEIISKIENNLSSGGIFIFSMPNKKSLNFFGRTNIKFHRTDINEIYNEIKKNNFEIMDIRTFTRIPDIFYEFSSNYYYSNLLNGSERLLEKIFGKVFLGRMLFIAVRKK